MNKEITFRFEKDPEYRIIVANGAWGGITPRGELNFDLFFEHIDTPEEISYMTTPDGLGPEVHRDPQPAPITRESMIGVVMTIDNAENFAKWILEKVSAVRKNNPHHSGQ